MSAETKTRAGRAKAKTARRARRVGVRERRRAKLAGKPLLVADLFCGAGGSSTGCRRALLKRGLKMQLVAVNHWPVAVATHTKNHPDARHYCVNLDAANPNELVPEGRLDLLMASPECKHHSQARGGKPINDQSRMSAWHVIRWCTDLRVRVVLIENVPEFQTWGPLDENDRPIPERKGEYFNAFVAALERIGFKVEWRVLNAADYGDATTRKRMFMIARSDGRPIEWPRQTHFENGTGKRRWRPAREIIDWSLEGRSIFDRKKALAPKTLLRIYAGALRFGWDEPYLVVLRQHMAEQGLDVPLPTVTAQGNHLAVAELRRRKKPRTMLLPQGEQEVTRTADNPLPTAVAVARIGLVTTEDAFVLNRHGENGATRAHDPAAPLPTATARGAGYLVKKKGRRAIVQANQHHNPAKDPDVDPIPSPTTSGGIFVAEAVDRRNGKRIGKPLVMRTGMHNSNALCVRDADRDPLATIASEGGMALLLPQGGGGATREVEKPAPTIHADGAVALVATYNRTGKAEPVDRPLKTATTKHRHALVTPVTHHDESCRARDVSSPLPAVTGANRGELAAVVARAAKKNAFMLAAFGERPGQTPRVHSVEKPAPTVCAKGRIPLASPDEREVDILFRMLEPHELAAAMGFSDRETQYEFTGNKTEVTKQIGNAVAVHCAAALVGAIFRHEGRRARRRARAVA
jgi:DNA (cytosine-5)-methyltransferase 1